MNNEDLAWIEKQKPRLVNAAEKYVERTGLYKPTKDTKNRPHGKRVPEIKTNQLRNLLNAAQGGDPLVLLINFLRYQIGRGKRGWPDEGSGEEMLKEFQALMELCDQQLPQNADSRLRLEALLAAQFLGFVIRDYTYQCLLAGTQP